MLSHKTHLCFQIHILIFLVKAFVKTKQNKTKYTQLGICLLKEPDFKIKIAFDWLHIY